MSYPWNLANISEKCFHPVSNHEDTQTAIWQEPVELENCEEISHTDNSNIS